MTSYEKTRIFSDYLEALNSKTPKAVKDTIVRLAATLFEAAEATVDPSEVAEDPSKLADYLGIDRLVDQIVSNPSDRSIKSVQDTVDSKIDELSGIYTNYEDLGLTKSVDKVYKAVLRTKKDPAEIDAAKKEVEAKLANIEQNHPSLDTDGIMAGIDDVIACATEGNMNEFQAKRQDVDNRLASIESGYTGINNIDASQAIAALTKALEDRGLVQVASKAKDDYRKVEQSQLMPKVQAWVNCIHKKAADDNQFETNYNNLVSNIEDLVETLKQEHPDLNADGLLTDIQSAKELVESNEKYDSLKGSIDTQVMRINALTEPENDLGVDMNNIRANIEKAIATDPASPEYQSVHDALASDISVLESKYTEIGETLSEDLMSNIDTVIEKGRSNDPGYEAAFNYINNQLSQIFTAITKATGSDAVQASPLKSNIASLYELLDKQLASNQGFRTSQDRLATVCTANCPDDHLVDLINHVSNLANERNFNEDFEGMLGDIVESTKDVDESKVNQLHNMNTKLSIMGRRYDIGAKIRQAFAKLYNLGSQQSDLATRERETEEARDQRSQVNQILGIDEMFNSLGKVSASELQAKFKERLEQLRQTVPVEQIDVSSIGEKIEGEKKALDIELVQANDNANKAREEFNKAQRQLDESVPENWDKLDELRKAARAAQKEVVDIKKKISTLNTAFDMAEFNRLVSEEKTTSRSLKLNTREDELRKGREAYSLSQHKDNGEQSGNEIDPSLLVDSSSYSIEDRQALISSLQDTLRKMLLVPAVRESYNNAIAGLKGAFAERRRMKEADPSADVSGVLAANYANGSLVQSEEGPWSCVEIAVRGLEPKPFPVYPFTELFGANPKAVVSVSDDGTTLIIKERELTLASGAKRPGSWEINIEADDSNVIVYASMPSNPDDPSEGYVMKLIDQSPLDEMRGRGAKPSALSFAFEELVAINPKMQV